MKSSRGIPISPLLSAPQLSKSILRVVQVPVCQLSPLSRPQLLSPPLTLRSSRSPLNHNRYLYSRSSGGSLVRNLQLLNCEHDLKRNVNVRPSYTNSYSRTFRTCAGVLKHEHGHANSQPRSPHGDATFQPIKNSEFVPPPATSATPATPATPTQTPLLNQSSPPTTLPPPTKTSTPPRRSLLRRFFAAYTTDIARHPVLYLTSFVSTHLTTMGLSVCTVWFFFNYFNYTPMGVPDFLITKGLGIFDGLVTYIGNSEFLGDRLGWVSKITKFKTADGARIVMQGAAAYGVVKLFFPLRVAGSLVLVPWVAKWVIGPMVNWVKRRATRVKPKKSA